MDRERAETFLRQLAEAELRRVSAQPGDSAAHAGSIARVIRVLRVLTAVQALGDEVAGQVLDDFELALGTRGVRTPAYYGRSLRSLMRTPSPHGPPAAPDHIVPSGRCSRSTTNRSAARSPCCRMHRRSPARC